MLSEYPAHLNLDVSTDNTKAINFYHRVGLHVNRTYVTEEEKIEFVEMGTPEDFVYTAPSYTERSHTKSESRSSQQVSPNGEPRSIQHEVEEEKSTGSRTAEQRALEM